MASLTISAGAMARSTSGVLRPHSRLAALLLLTCASATTLWLLSLQSLETGFVGGAAGTSIAHTRGLILAVESEARRRGCTARQAVGLFYATQTGNTEIAASAIAKKAGVEAIDVGEISADDLAGFEGLIVGCPTWNTGADDYRTGTSWDDLLDEIRSVNLAGKPVAIFGCGDSRGYGKHFCDGIEEMHETFKAAGAKMVGYVDAGGYQHQASKSVRDDKFLGLPLDEDNEGDLTEGRVESWVAQIKREGMPL